MTRMEAEKEAFNANTKAPKGVEYFAVNINGKYRVDKYDGRKSKIRWRD